MKHSTHKIRILVIDSEGFWRQIARETFDSLRLNVSIADGYILDEMQLQPAPNLVVLGCAFVGSAERELIERLVSRDLHVLILVVKLTPDIMRELFLTGIHDVREKTYDTDHLSDIVSELLLKESMHTGSFI